MPKLTDPKTIGTFEQADGKHDGQGEVRDDKLTDNGPPAWLVWMRKSFPDAKDPSASPD